MMQVLQMTLMVSPLRLRELKEAMWILLCKGYKPCVQWPQKLTLQQTKSLPTEKVGLESNGYFVGQSVNALADCHLVLCYACAWLFGFFPKGLKIQSCGKFNENIQVEGNGIGILKDGSLQNVCARNDTPDGST